MTAADDWDRYAELKGRATVAQTERIICARAERDELDTLVAAVDAGRDEHQHAQQRARVGGAR